MSFIPVDYKDIDRSLYWISCFFSTDCPAPGVAATVISTSFTVDATVE